MATEKEYSELITGWGKAGKKSEQLKSFYFCWRLGFYYKCQMNVVVSMAQQIYSFHPCQIRPKRNTKTPLIHKHTHRPIYVVIQDTRKISGKKIKKAQNNKRKLCKRPKETKIKKSWTILSHAKQQRKTL